MRGAEICEQSGQPGAVHADAAFISTLLGPAKSRDWCNLNCSNQSTMHQNELASVGAAKLPNQPRAMLRSPLAYRLVFRQGKVAPLQEIQSCGGREASLAFHANLAKEWLVVKGAQFSYPPPLKCDNTVLSDQGAHAPAAAGLNQQIAVSVDLEDSCISQGSEIQCPSTQHLGKQSCKGELLAFSLGITGKPLHVQNSCPTTGWKSWCDDIMSEAADGSEPALERFLLLLRSNLHCTMPDSELIEREPA